MVSAKAGDAKEPIVKAMKGKAVRMIAKVETNELWTSKPISHEQELVNDEVQLILISAD